MLDARNCCSELTQAGSFRHNGVVHVNTSVVKMNTLCRLRYFSLSNIELF